MGTDTAKVDLFRVETVQFQCIFQIPLKYTSNRKKAIEETVLQTFDLTVTLKLFGSAL